MGAWRTPASTATTPSIARCDRASPTPCGTLASPTRQEVRMGELWNTPRRGGASDPRRLQPTYGRPRAIDACSCDGEALSAAGAAARPEIPRVGGRRCRRRCRRRRRSRHRRRPRPHAGPSRPVAANHAEPERANPVQLSGDDPPHEDLGQELRVHAGGARRRHRGKIVARCVITAQGAVTGCRVLHSLPHLDQEVLGTLQGQRYTPVLLRGRALDVEYTFVIRFALDDSPPAPSAKPLPAAPPRP